LIASATVASLSLALAACSGDDGDGGSGAVDLSADAPTGVTLTVWHSTADSQAVLDLYAAYEAASGNTIELVDIPNDTYTASIQTKWSTGERPDILEYQPTSQDMAQLNMAENMIDLSALDFVEAEGDLAETAGSLDGKVYAAVLGPIQTFGVYYNKDVLSAAGVEVPTSYDELLADCDAIAATGAAPVFIGGGSEFPVMMLAGFTYMADFNEGDEYGLGVKNGEIKVNDADSPLVGGLQLLVDLRDAGCLNDDAGTATFQDAISAVASGAAATTVLPSDFIPMFYDAGADDSTVGFGAISAHEGRAAYVASLMGTFFAPKTGDTTQERAAVDFIDWVTTEGYQDYVDAAQIAPTMSTATAPEMTGLYADMNDMLLAEGRTLAFNSSIPGFGNFGKIAVKVLVGQSTPQEGADEFQTFIDQARTAQQ